MTHSCRPFYDTYFVVYCVVLVCFVCFHTSLYTSLFINIELNTLMYNFTPFELIQEITTSNWRHERDQTCLNLGNNKRMVCY